MKILLLGLLVLSIQGKTSHIEESFSNNTITVSDWELAKNKDGIKVHTRQSAGSKIKEFKAVTTVSCEMKSLEDIIDKVEDYSSWQKNIATSKVLMEEDTNKSFVYLTTKMPMLISNRDVVLYSVKSLDTQGVLTYALKSSSSYGNKKEGFIRMTSVRGKWQFTPKQGGKIEVVNQFYGNPEGDLPTWLINAFIVDGPYETLANLKGLVND